MLVIVTVPFSGVSIYQSVLPPIRLNGCFCSMNYPVSGHSISELIGTSNYQEYKGKISLDFHYFHVSSRSRNYEQRSRNYKKRSRKKIS